MTEAAFATASAVSASIPEISTPTPGGTSGTSSGPATAADILPPQKAARATHFAFEHKIFQVSGAVFGRNDKTGETGLFVPLGDLQAFLTMADVRQQFKPIADGDLALFEIVDRSLKFVKEIRPGDNIPAEILDGSASWKVDPIHRDRARGRIFAAALGKAAGPYEARLMSGDIATLERDPAFRALVQKSISAIAAVNGVSDSAAVLDKMESIAREMSYIEALRDRYNLVTGIASSIRTSQRLYKSARAVLEPLSRVVVLLGNPVKRFSDIFDNIDAQVGEIAVVLRQIDKCISFVRESRDDLHARLMIWTG